MGTAENMHSLDRSRAVTIVRILFKVYPFVLYCVVSPLSSSNFTTFKLCENTLKYLKDSAMNEELMLSLVQGTEQIESACEHLFESACHLEGACGHNSKAVLTRTL